MRIRKRKWVDGELAVCNYYIKNPEEYKGKWQESFKIKQPLYVELGCGKGNFISEFASRNTNVNIIAVDIKIDMVGIAKRKIEKVFKEKNIENIDNVKLVVKNIEQIEEIFSPEDNIEKLFINFCNPWPKPKHRKKRLTHTRQLEHYKTFLKKGSKIYFKTDDDNLFEDTLKYLLECNFKILKKTYDLHAENIKDNIITEHEQMFSEEGIKIKALVAILE